MCAEIQKEKDSRLMAQSLLKTQENENSELKNKNKINEEKIAILEEKLRKAESVAETYEDVASKKAKQEDK
uniref:Uncharacterized protein n=1 Tax=Panagrolaimus sp. PS1159 TaxID=55785 RepID=A0AC35GUH0_9BILA